MSLSLETAGVGSDCIRLHGVQGQNICTALRNYYQIPRSAYRSKCNKHLVFANIRMCLYFRELLRWTQRAGELHMCFGVVTCIESDGKTHILKPNKQQIVPFSSLERCHGNAIPWPTCRWPYFTAKHLNRSCLSRMISGNSVHGHDAYYIVINTARYFLGQRCLKILKKCTSVFVALYFVRPGGGCYTAHCLKIIWMC
jgi:hypothetical protein